MLKYAEGNYTVERKNAGESSNCWRKGDGIQITSDGVNLRLERWAIYLQ